MVALLVQSSLQVLKRKPCWQAKGIRLLIVVTMAPLSPVRSEAAFPHLDKPGVLQQGTSAWRRILDGRVFISHTESGARTR